MPRVSYAIKIVESRFHLNISIQVNYWKSSNTFVTCSYISSQLIYFRAVYRGRSGQKNTVAQHVELTSARITEWLSIPD